MKKELLKSEIIHFHQKGNFICNYLPNIIWTYISWH